MKTLPTEPRMKLNISWKVHMVTHIPQFLHGKKHGLARYAEQASESYHSNIRATLQRSKRKKNHKDKAEKQRRAVRRYSSRRLGGPKIYKFKRRFGVASGPSGDT